MDKKGLNLNNMTDTLDYCRLKGWLETDIDDFDEQLIIQKQRAQIKYKSQKYKSQKYKSQKYKNKIKPGDIIKVSNNICKIINYNLNNKKHKLMILSHPLLRITYVYLKITNYTIISTRILRDDITSFNKNILNKCNNKKVNLITNNIKLEIEEYINYDKNALDIQRIYRGYHIKSEFKNKMKSIIDIQRIYRGYHIKSEFKNKMKSIIDIQRIYRGYHIKSDFQNKMKSTKNMDSNSNCIIM